MAEKTPKKANRSSLFARTAADIKKLVLFGANDPSEEGKQKAALADRQRSDYAAEQARVRANASPTFQVTPDWVTNSTTSLEIKWDQSLKMEKAYELFKEAYQSNKEITTKAGKKLKLQKHIQDATRKRFRKQNEGGEIAQWEQIEKALGPHEAGIGTNWLRSHTSYRRFGLLTGYNMQSLPEHATVWASDGDDEAKYALGEGEVFSNPKWYQLNVDEKTAATEKIEFTKLQRKSDPRWKSGVKGQAEPGIQVGGDDKWRERVSRGGSTPLAGRLKHVPFSHKRKFFKGAPGIDHPTKFPLMHQASFGDDGKEFYTPQAAYAEVYGSNDGYGHFLSPAIMFYYTIQEGRQKIDSALFLNARTALKDKAQPYIDDFRSKCAAYGTNKDYMKLATGMWDQWGAPGIYQSFGGVVTTGAGTTDRSSAKPLSNSRALDRDGSKKWIPRVVAIYPTLPLESFFPTTEQQKPGSPENLAFYRGKHGGAAASMSVTAADAATLNSSWIGAKNENITDDWKDLFASFENGTGAFGDLSAKIDTVVTGTRPGAGSFGDGVDGSDSYNRELIDVYFETILDFFGAGLLDAPTALQSEGATEAGDGDYNLDDIADDLKKNILNYRVLKPFDFQCFLMENIDRVSEFQQQKGFYRNVVRVSCPGQAPYGTSPADLISTIHRGGNAGAIDLLLNLDPAVYALLVPYIKLYRVDYDSNNPTVPISEQSIPIPNFVNPDDITAMTAAGEGRIRGWGLQSFTWGLDGVQPETVDNNISATLTCYFQSLQDFFQGSRYAGAPVATPLDLLISPRTAAVVGVEGAGESDDTPPINEPAPACAGILKDNINQEYDGAYYRIKVATGWATPPGLQNLLPDWGPDEITQLERAIDTTRTILYLQQTRHNIDMNQDGSVVLSINYQAALNGMLTSNRADILGANDVDSRIRLKKLEDELIGEREVLARMKTNAANSASDSPEKKALKTQRQKVAEVLEAKKKIINQDRLKKYSRFLAPLYGRIMSPDGVLTQGAEESKIYALEVNAEELLQKPMHEMDFEERAAKARQRMGSDSGYAMTSTSNKKNTNLLEAISTAVLGGEDAAKEISKQFAEDWKVSIGKADNIYIPYFYLGDLIDLILESNADLGSAQQGVRKYMTMLADFDVINPLVLYQSENAGELACSSKVVDDTALVAQLRAKGYGFTGGISKRINLGSVPISLDAFNVWFKDNVIKKERNTYYLIHFLKDICSQLIGVALKNACFGDNIINNIRFDTNTIQFHNPKEENVYPAFDNDGAPATIDVDNLAHYCGLVDEQNGIAPPLTKEEDKDKYDVTQGLLLYSTDMRPATRVGVNGKGQDEGVGIYHNYLGASRGLVKSINFSRVDQPYLREAKIQKFGNLGAQQLRELYSANVEMIGNGLYKNGQLMFIWPGFMGADDDMARLLGLGGYFLVTGVNHTINRSGYNVSVTALQEGVAFDDGSPLIVASPGDTDIPINQKPSPPATEAEAKGRPKKRAPKKEAPKPPQDQYLSDNTRGAMEGQGLQALESSQESWATPLNSAELEFAESITEGLTPQQSLERYTQMRDASGGDTAYTDRMMYMFNLHSQGSIGEGATGFGYTEDN